MDLTQYKQEIALPADSCDSFLNLAFDGCNYYLLHSCECKVSKYDLDFNRNGCAETQRKYNCFCYDFVDNCFWAVSNTSPHRIYKLDCCFQEIDSIHFYLPKGVGGIITGISFDCCQNDLLLAYTDMVLRFDKASECVKILYTDRCERISGVISLCPFYAVTKVCGGKQNIALFDKRDMGVCEKCLPPCFHIKNIVLNPCRDECGRVIFYALAMKRGCYPYILEYTFSCSELGFNLCKCNDDICKKFCCRDQHCRRSCDAAAEVLESIALVEASIAHILNAEGEKLQKVIASTDDICKIMDVNKSVQRTIEKATNLEFILYEKMDVLRELCDLSNSDCFSCPEDKCKSSDNHCH